MIKYNYILTPLDSKTLERTANIIDSEKVLIESYTVNSLFDTATNICSVKVYSLNDDLVETVKDYTNFQVEGGGASAGSIGVSQISINPIADVQELGYENGDVKLVYNFSNDTLSDSKAIYTLFVEEISQDRTELRGLTTIDSDEGFSNKVNAFIEKFNSSQYLNEVYFKYGDEEIKVLNIGFEKVDKGSSIIVKLYKPLPSTVSQNTLFNIEETISDSIGYEVSAELVPEVFKPSNLKGPNFNVEIADENSNPTEFFNYNELFSYPVTGSNYELLALFNETSAQIDVDHNDYSDFIHFSSAEERLRNFKYKLDLIKSYESTISSIKSSGYVPNNASGSSQYYEGLVSGVVKNFDHYDRFLYFQSGSNSWPKENSSKPYENYISSNAATENWYLNQLTVAENFE